MHCSKWAAVKLLQSYWEKTPVPGQNLRDIYYRKAGYRFYTKKLRIELTEHYKDTTNFFQEEFQSIFPRAVVFFRMSPEDGSQVRQFKTPFSISFIITFFSPCRDRSKQNHTNFIILF